MEVPRRKLATTRTNWPMGSSQGLHALVAAQEIATPRVPSFRGKRRINRRQEAVRIVHTHRLLTTIEHVLIWGEICLVGLRQPSP